MFQSKQEGQGGVAESSSGGLEHEGQLYMGSRGWMDAEEGAQTPSEQQPAPRPAAAEQRQEAGSPAGRQQGHEEAEGTRSQAGEADGQVCRATLPFHAFICCCIWYNCRHCLSAHQEHDLPLAGGWSAQGGRDLAAACARGGGGGR